MRQDKQLVGRSGSGGLSGGRTTPKSMLSKLKQNETALCAWVCVGVRGCACVDFFRFVLKSLERSRTKKIYIYKERKESWRRTRIIWLAKRGQHARRRGGLSDEQTNERLTPINHADFTYH